MLSTSVFMSLLEAVIEAPSIDVEPLWSVAKLPPFSFLRLWQGMTPDEVGLFVYQLAAYGNHDEFDLASPLDEVLKYITGKESFILIGGLRVNGANGVTINPSCCCGLENWRDWEGLLAGENHIWLGHSPDPWIERQGDSIRLWADQGSETFIDFQTTELAEGLHTVQRDLLGFLDGLAQWLEVYGKPYHQLLLQQIDESFSITPKPKDSIVTPTKS